MAANLEWIWGLEQYPATMNISWGRIAVTCVVMGLITGCGSGGPRVVGDDALQNVAEGVAVQHKGEAWMDRIDTVYGGVLADIKIETDLDASIPADMELALTICEAYASSIKTEKPFVLVYGNSTTVKEKIDGSVEEEVFEAAKLARATTESDGSIKCIEAGLMR